MRKRGRTVLFDGVEYRLTLKGRLYAAWISLMEKIKGWH